MAAEIRVLIADDHAIFRQGLRAILEGEEDVTVIGEAGNGRDAAAMALELEPDLVIMDIAMPLLNGVEATRQIVKARPGIKVLALSMHHDEKYVFQVLKAGASGYVVKEAAASELLTAIRSVNSGNPFFSPAISRRIMDSYLKDEDEKKPRAGTGKLTERENEVLQLIAEGYTNNEIAKFMNISVKTVETHRAHIMGKLDIHDLAGLIKYAINKGIIVLGEV